MCLTDNITLYQINLNLTFSKNILNIIIKMLVIFNIGQHLEINFLFIYILYAEIILDTIKKGIAIKF